MAEKKQWIVRCEITGACTVCVEAESKEQAKQMANEGDWVDCDLIEWAVDKAISAEVND